MSEGVPENVVCDTDWLWAGYCVLLSFLAAQVMRGKHAQVHDSQQQTRRGPYEGVSHPSKSVGDPRHCESIL